MASTKKSRASNTKKKASTQTELPQVASDEPTPVEDLSMAQLIEEFEELGGQIEEAAEALAQLEDRKKDVASRLAEELGVMDQVRQAMSARTAGPPNGATRVSRMTKGVKARWCHDVLRSLKSAEDQGGGNLAMSDLWFNITQGDEGLLSKAQMSMTIIATLKKQGLIKMEGERANATYSLTAKGRKDVVNLPSGD